MSMLKFAAVLLFTLVATVASVRAQQLENAALAPMFEALQAKNWQEAHAIANQLLLKHDKEQTNTVALTRYVALYTGAALVANEKLTYEQFTPYAMQFVGKALIMAAHPTSADTTITAALNTTVFQKQNGTLTAFVACTNEDRSKIYSFEYLKFAEEFDPSQYDGKATRAAGYLESIELNPEKKLNWIMRLHLERSTIHLWQKS